ncbi:MAG: M20/M25/M40 family metallo-hydrolase [Acidobacteriaceae bacterium]
MPTLRAHSTLAQIGQLAAQRRVHQAFRFLHLNDGRLLDWQRGLTAIPAPPFGEGPRAQWLLAQFQALGLCETSIDSEGNVLGLLPQSEQPEPSHREEAERATLVLSAHIDTVFPLGTSIEPQIHGKRLVAPGACDNAAGVTGLLAIAAALLDANFDLPCRVLFIGNVGEEGEGNLRGMRYLYQNSAWRDMIVANIVLDGAGSEVAVTEALGSRRFLVTVSGPGGHSWTDAGAPNPIAILSEAIARLAALELSEELPTAPRTTLNVGTIEGGSSVNAIPERAAARFDLRSTGSEQLIRLEVELHRAVEDAVLRANAAATSGSARRKQQVAHFTIENIGDRPAGRLADDSALAQTLRAVDRHLGIRTETRVASTDANIPLSLGIPAVSLGAGGDGGGIHTRNEWYDPTGRELALKRILLLVLATAERCGEPAENL